MHGDKKEYLNVDDDDGVRGVKVRRIRISTLPLGCDCPSYNINFLPHQALCIARSLSLISFFFPGGGGGGGCELPIFKKVYKLCFAHVPKKKKKSSAS